VDQVDQVPGVAPSDGRAFDALIAGLALGCVLAAVVLLRSAARDQQDPPVVRIVRSAPPPAVVVVEPDPETAQPGPVS
jgi:ABC-type nitrate/sulfonate/bicarbonate transport system permease component